VEIQRFDRIHSTAAADLESAPRNDFARHPSYRNTENHRIENKGLLAVIAKVKLEQKYIATNGSG
jgi:hypothetical protein